MTSCSTSPNSSFSFSVTILSGDLSMRSWQKSLKVLEEDISEIAEDLIWAKSGEKGKWERVKNLLLSCFEIEFAASAVDACAYSEL